MLVLFGTIFIFRKCTYIKFLTCSQPAFQLASLRCLSSRTLIIAHALLPRLRTMISPPRRDASHLITS